MSEFKLHYYYSEISGAANLKLGTMEYSFIRMS